VEELARGQRKKPLTLPKLKFLQNMEGRALKVALNGGLAIPKKQRCEPSLEAAVLVLRRTFEVIPAAFDLTLEFQKLLVVRLKARCLVDKHEQHNAFLRRLLHDWLKNKKEKILLQLEKEKEGG
jgi:hypothetical protein